MKITGMTVIFNYDNGEHQDVSSYVPASIWSDLENFADYWQEGEVNEEEKENA
jgi:hypothetical protein